jgi:hypothetical protein
MKKYCLKCKRPTPNAVVPTIQFTKNNRALAVTRCEVCNAKKCYFIKNEKTGRGILNKVIDALPVEMHLPGYRYCGPGTKLHKRLRRGDVGINVLDEACKTHDIAYSQSSDLTHRHDADKILAANAQKIREDPNSGWKEKLAATVVKKAMDTKVRWGMGKKKKKKP